MWKEPNNSIVMQKLRNRVFANGSTTEPMQRVHVLDLCDNGYVKPHIDSTRVSMYLIFILECIKVINYNDILFGK